jgi:hypothetical protein
MSKSTPRPNPTAPRRPRALLLAAVLALSGTAALADAAALRQKHAQVQEHMRSSDMGRDLHIDSSETGDTLQGDVYAVLDHPYATVRAALKEPARWCDILILPFNTKYCHAVESAEGPGLMVRIGRKYDQPLQNAYRLDFSYRNVAAGTDYFESRLNAGDGPLGTRDYRIVLAAAPLPSGQTFMHLSDSYGSGVAGRLAMQGYLATVGADKVGFTVTGRTADGQPRYIGGVRGAVERNAMRYYLAIDSYLDSLDAPAGKQVEKRIQTWFNASERYPKQLREMERRAYVSMKLLEVERQQTMIRGLIRDGG